jgi:hypothetical protein
MLLIFFFSNFIFSQKCGVEINEYGLVAVGVDEIKCLAKNYDGYTLIYTFGL